MELASAAVGLLDVSARFTKYILEIRKGAKYIDQELESLGLLIRTCEQTVQAIEKSYRHANEKSSDESWRELTWMIEQSKELITGLQDLVARICGSSENVFTRHIESWLQAHRRMSKDKELQQYQRTLDFYQRAMSIILQRIDQHDSNQARQDTSWSLKGLQSQVGVLQDQISDLSDTMSPLSRAESFPHSALHDLKSSIRSRYPKNTHFYTPQSVQSFFTGRTEAFQDLEKIILQPAWPLEERFQRRFVVQGIAGSGKTQFCCKFAELNRHKFWGVFWVDGSSDETIKEGLRDIARIPGRDANPNAALDWLSTVDEQWLLLIDNADDGRVRLEQYFPRGDGGSILITTRNPKFKILGNVGPGYYNFSGLEQEEASDLLLKASDLPRPWKPSWAVTASEITNELGFLVLAIIQAAATIRDQLCELQGYLKYFNRQWKQLRSTPNVKQLNNDERAIYVTYELCFGRLESRDDLVVVSDAKDILHMFAYLSREDFSVEILIRAMKNAQTEADYERETARTQVEEDDKQVTSISERVWGKLLPFAVWMLGKNTALPLPNFIRDGRKPGGFDDAVDRARRALQELSHLSLISHNKDNDTYAMHPLTHKWARERLWDTSHPRSNNANQALWAEVAGQVLAASVLVPPLGNTPSDERYHVKLHSHIEHVQTFRSSIAEQLASASIPLWHRWFGRADTIPQSRLRMMAKFCVVYAQCGNAQKAQGLLETIVDFLSNNLGPNNDRTRLAKGRLSTMYLDLGEAEKAEELQFAIVTACEKDFGPNHRNTLVACDQLGCALWQQGRFSEAREWQKRAVNGLRKVLGGKHYSTLEAIDNLARTVAKFWQSSDLDEAFQLHTEAIRGMEKINHPRTTFAKESLARLSSMMGADLPQAYSMIEDVIATRSERNGKEAPWTLMAKGCKACVLGAMGRFAEGESLMLEILGIAERNEVGEDHLGFLMGRQILATIICEQGRNAEAETILRDVSQRQKHMPSSRGDFHPDRIVTLIELARCLQIQGKLDESIEVCDMTIKGLETTTKRLHPFTETLIAAKGRMRSIQGAEPSISKDAVIEFPNVPFKKWARPSASLTEEPISCL